MGRARGGLATAIALRTQTGVWLLAKTNWRNTGETLQLLSMLIERLTPSPNRSPAACSLKRSDASLRRSASSSLR